MSSFLSYELLLNLRSIDIISIKQSSFFQLRFTVYQSTPTQHHHLAVPFLVLKSNSIQCKTQRSQNDPLNTAETDSANNTFLTRRFIARSMDDSFQLNQMCIFRGTILLDKQQSTTSQLRLFCQLLTYQQNQAQVLTEWQGSTTRHTGSGFCPIYFNSYKITCCVQASIYAVVSAVSLDSLMQDYKSLALLIKNVGKCLFFRKYCGYLEKSIEGMKKTISQLNDGKQKDWKDIDQLYKLSPESYRYQQFIQKPIREQLSLDQIKKMQLRIQNEQMDSFIGKFKQGVHVLNQTVYQFWKQLQTLLMNNYNQKYDTLIREQYKQQIRDYHRSISFKVQDSPEVVAKNQLFIYPFERNQTFFKFSKLNLQYIFNQKKSQCKQLIVFVHGYQASSYDMEPLSNYLKYKYPNILTLLSSVNEGRTEQPIQDSAHRLAIQIKNYINSLELRQFKISFVCHSLGGIIGRACLKYLQLHKDKFNQYVSLCSPHLGYLYHSSTLISTSLWLLNKFKKDPSMIELTMEDSPQLQKTYLYGLSSSRELGWFNRIWLFGSKEDEYVPYWSAILQEKSFIFETQSAKVYKQLLQNLTADIEQKIVRCQIIFNQKSRDLSNFIGRTAHIKILNYLPGLQLFAAAFQP